MGRYVDSEGYVWQGPVYCCYECSYWVKGPSERQGCTQHGLYRQLVDKFGAAFVSRENDCPDWRPG